MIKITVDRKFITPEVQEWLRELEKKVIESPEFKKAIYELMVFGEYQILIKGD